MKIEAINTTMTSDNEKIFIVWIKDKSMGITKCGRTFKSFLTKNLIVDWLKSQKVYNIKQAMKMLNRAN